MSRRAREGYEATPHTAEVGLRAWGPTFEGALEQLARGLVSLIVDPDTMGGDGDPEETMALTATGHDREDLAVAWLNEILGRIDAEQVVLRDFAVTVRSVEAVGEEGSGVTEDTWRLEARAAAEKMNPDRHAFLSEVKAATLHEAAVEDVVGVAVRGVGEGPPARVEIRLLLDV
jgi:tRNA nucleotidyltransferase (CCA-adding enzyme)